MFERVSNGDRSCAPCEDHALVARREPSALERWVLEIPFFDKKKQGISSSHFYERAMKGLNLEGVRNLVF